MAAVPTGRIVPILDIKTSTSLAPTCPSLPDEPIPSIWDQTPENFGLIDPEPTLSLGALVSAAVCLCALLAVLCGIGALYLALNP